MKNFFYIILNLFAIGCSSCSQAQLPIKSGKCSRLTNCLILSLILPLMVGMVSCGNDEEDELSINPATPLYGAWTTEKTTIGEDGHRTDEEITIIFDDKGYLKGTGKGLVWGEGNSATFTWSYEYRYKVLGNTLNLYKMDAIDSQPCSIFSYSIKGNNLNLEYLSGEKRLFLNGKETNVVFTRK